MLQALRKLLAECHVTGEHKLLKFIQSNRADYCLHRATEEIHQVLEHPQADNVDERLKLAIQLLNIARFKIKANHGAIKDQTDEARRTGSKTPAGDN
jgi:hypothetical protein